MIQPEPARLVRIDGVHYTGIRFFDHDAHYVRIEIRDTASGTVLARATQENAESAATFETLGPVPLTIVKWLVGWTRSFASPDGASDWDQVDAKLRLDIAEAMAIGPAPVK